MHTVQIVSFYRLVTASGFDRVWATRCVLTSRFFFLRKSIETCLRNKWSSKILKFTAFTFSSRVEIYLKHVTNKPNKLHCVCSVYYRLVITNKFSTSDTTP